MNVRMQTNLVKRGSVFYFRKKIPQDLRDHYGRESVRRRLKACRTQAEAKREAGRLADIYEAEFEAVRRGRTAPSVPLTLEMVARQGIHGRGLQRPAATDCGTARQGSQRLCTWRPFADPRIDARLSGRRADRTGSGPRNMMQQSGELCIATTDGRLSYAFERRSHVVSPPRSAGHACCEDIPLGLPPSLHHLRCHRDFTRGIVRRLLRYYAAVRLPVPLTHRRTPEGFTMCSAANASQRAAEERGTSRFPCRTFPRVYGVSDRAGSSAASPSRHRRCDLRSILTTSAPRSSRALRHGVMITRLNGRPASTPVNASPTPSRLRAHDSGPPWLVGPSTYDSFIHNIPPVLTGAPKFLTGSKAMRIELQRAADAVRGAGLQVSTPPAKPESSLSSSFSCFLMYSRAKASMGPNWRRAACARCITSATT